MSTFSQSLRCTINLAQPNSDNFSLVHNLIEKYGLSIVNVFVLDQLRDSVHISSHTIPNTRLLFHGSKVPYWVPLAFLLFALIFSTRLVY